MTQPAVSNALNRLRDMFRTSSSSKPRAGSDIRPLALWQGIEGR